MKAAILSVGTELLFGQIINTNTAYLSKELNLLGIDVMYHYTVGDNPKRLKDMIDIAFEECDLILTTGGLGPTQDDLTKEIVCETLHDELVFHQPSMDIMEAIFKKLNRPMTENNKKQAYVPSRGTIFINAGGTAPGFALEENSKCIICMPGPPREMNKMFQEQAKPYLQKKSDSVIYYKMIRTIGIGESQLETDLLDLIDGQTDPTLATYAKEGEAALRIASKRATEDEAKIAVEDMIEKVKHKIGKYIYSTEDENLSDVVGKILLEKNITISCAESCTGGLFATTITDISGISKIFDRGIVAYSNESKIEQLNVKRETLEKFGAVSAETAKEMAEGLREISGSDICIAVTGIAGPDGGTEEKPVGLIYISMIYKGHTSVKEMKLRNLNRKTNRSISVLYMFDEIRKALS